MTTHYIDLSLRPDPETSGPALLGALYDHLHLALVQQQRDDVGVSFPGYSMTPRTLGATLRLHGKEATLQAFMQNDWLRGMRDHVRISGIDAAPSGARHRPVRRKQFKTNVDRLRRRRMKRKGETMEQARAAIPASMEHHPHLPYVHLHSRSTGQTFCLFIALGPLLQEAIDGHFNSHGLSRGATVPWF